MKKVIYKAKKVFFFFILLTCTTMLFSCSLNQLIEIDELSETNNYSNNSTTTIFFQTSPDNYFYKTYKKGTSIDLYEIFPEEIEDKKFFCWCTNKELTKKLNEKEYENYIVQNTTTFYAKYLSYFKVEYYYQNNGKEELYDLKKMLEGTDFSHQDVEQPENKDGLFFVGWKPYKEYGETVNENRIYTASYTQKVNIKYQDEDGNVLFTEQNVSASLINANTDYTERYKAKNGSVPTKEVAEGDTDVLKYGFESFVYKETNVNDVIVQATYNTYKKVHVILDVWNQSDLNEASTHQIFEDFTTFDIKYVVTPDGIKIFNTTDLSSSLQKKYFDSEPINTDINAEDGIVAQAIQILSNNTFYSNYIVKGSNNKEFDKNSDTYCINLIAKIKPKEDVVVSCSENLAYSLQGSSKIVNDNYDSKNSYAEYDEAFEQLFLFSKTVDFTTPRGDSFKINIEERNYINMLYGLKIYCSMYSGYMDPYLELNYSESIECEFNINIEFKDSDYFYNEIETEKNTYSYSVPYKAIVLFNIKTSQISNNDFVLYFNVKFDINYSDERMTLDYNFSNDVEYYCHSRTMMGNSSFKMEYLPSKNTLNESLNLILNNPHYDNTKKYCTIDYSNIIEQENSLSAVNSIIEFVGSPHANKQSTFNTKIYGSCPLYGVKVNIDYPQEEN